MLLQPSTLRLELMTGTVRLEAATWRTGHSGWWRISVTGETARHGITVYLDRIIQGLCQRVLTIELFVTAERREDWVKLSKDLGLEVTSTHT